MAEEASAKAQTGSAEETTTKIELTGETALVDLYQMSATESMDKVRQAGTSTSLKDAKTTWKVDDLCMAPYAGDGRWYHAKIVKLDGPKCRVCYTEYDEEDEVQVSQLLNESDVEHPDEDDGDEEQMETVVYEKKQTNSSKQTKNNSRPPVPAICPPPPELFNNLPKITNEKESLTNMLMAWYMAGYHTGYHKGYTDRERQK